MTDVDVYEIDKACRGRGLTSSMRASSMNVEMVETTPRNMLKQLSMTKAVLGTVNT